MQILSRLYWQVRKSICYCFISAEDDRRLLQQREDMSSHASQFSFLKKCQDNVEGPVIGTSSCSGLHCMRGILNLRIFIRSRRELALWLAGVVILSCKVAYYRAQPRNSLSREVRILHLGHVQQDPGFSQHISFAI